jgi:hypothetical protein
VDEFQVIYQVSARRILKLFKFSRSTYYYKQVEDHQAIIIKQKIKDIAAVRVSMVIVGLMFYSSEKE